MGESKGNNNIIAKVVGAILAVAVIVVLIVLLVKGCAAKEYEVTFDTQGGSLVETIKVKANDKIEKPNDPIRDGYTFGGWYLDDQLFDFNTKITKNITLKARWIQPGDESGITLDMSSHSLKVGTKDKLSATLNGDAKGQELVWSSSNENVVKVDQNGNIEALKVGSATITVTTKDGKYKATCKVTVVAEEVAVENVTLKGTTTVQVGSTIKLTATVTPTNATNKRVTYKSSNTSIATVDAYGRVTGKKAGTVVITVTTVDGKKTATITITVVNVPSKPAEDTPTVKPEDNPQPSEPTEPTKPEESNPQPSEPTEPEKEVKQYTVTFNSDGGSSIDSQTVEENKTAKQPENPVKDGYTFDGWYYGNDKYDFNSPVTKNIELKAKWTANYTFYVEAVSNGMGGNEVFSRVYVYRGTTEITSSATIWSGKGTGYLGRYDDTQKAIVINNNEIGKIAVVRDGGNFYDADRVYTKR